MVSLSSSYSDHDPRTTPSSSQQQQQQQQQVRHAGKVHIRGKIRRIWRPRYLELLDNGMVRYYELSSSDDYNNDTTAITMNPPPHQQHNHNNYPPKCTLTITGSRILDVTTLRDMHVGLPRGSYGFLFRGQKVNTTNHYDAVAVAADSPIVLVDHPHAHPTTSSSCFMPNAQTTNSTTTTGGSHNNNNSSSSSSEPRDFLCAVTTLEEAQMWVVALQWAASAPSLSSSPWWTCPRQPELDELRTSKSLRNTKVTTTTTTSTTSNSSSSSVSKQKTTSTSVQQQQHQQQQQQQQGSSVAVAAAGGIGIGAGKVVVSKVVRYRTVRLHRFQFEIAYEIHGLLLYDNIAEEWSMIRTADDFQLLVTNLCKELGPHMLDRAQLGPIRQLPRYNNHHHNHNKKLLPVDLQNSISIVDSILRSLVMDAAMVNANAMKQFLGLNPKTTTTKKKTTTTTTNTTSTWWNYHDPESILSRTQERIGTTTTSTDQYVKQWLLRKTELAATFQQSQELHGRDVMTLFLVQRPIWFVSGLTFSSVAVVPLAARCIWMFQSIPMSIPTVSIRLDFLVASWVGAAYLGRNYYSSSSSCSSSASKTTTTTTIHQQQRHINKRNYHAKEKKKSLQQQSTRTTQHPQQPVRKSKEKTTTTTTTSADQAADDSNVSSIAESNAETAILIEDDGDGVVSAGSEVDENSSSEGDELNAASSMDDYHDDDDDDDDDDDNNSGGAAAAAAAAGEYHLNENLLPSPLPQHPDNDGYSCWSQPTGGPDDKITFHVRGANYLQDRVKIPSGPPAMWCRGVDIWMTDNPERHIARHPAMLGGRLQEEDTFMVNFLLPFGNFVSYFGIPPLSEFPNDKLRTVWTKFLQGDQQYRDARLKLLPVVVDGPWIVKTAVGPGKSPALLGKVIPLQYFFRHPDKKTGKKGIYEVDVIITASTIAKGILSIVKGHTKSVSIAFAFIIEAAEQEELPETVLCSFQIHAIHLEDCPLLPPCNLDDIPF